jgi:hypothetical protein
MIRRPVVIVWVGPTMQSGGQSAKDEGKLTPTWPFAAATAAGPPNHDSRSQFPHFQLVKQNFARARVSRIGLGGNGTSLITPQICACARIPKHGAVIIGPPHLSTDVMKSYPAPPIGPSNSWYLSMRCTARISTDHSTLPRYIANTHRTTPI